LASGNEAGVEKKLENAAANGLQEGQFSEGEQARKECDGAIDEAVRAFLLGRIVIDEIEQDAHVQGPEGGGEKGANVIRQALIANGGGEDGEALLAIPERAGTECGEWVKRLAGEAEESTEEFAVALQDFEFGVKGDGEAFFEREVLA